MTAEPDEITVLLRRLEIHIRKGEHAIAVEVLTKADIDVAPVMHRDPRRTSESSKPVRARQRGKAGRETTSRRKGRST